MNHARAARACRLTLATAIGVVAALATASAASATTVGGQLDSCDPTSTRAVSGNPPTSVSASAPPAFETVTFTAPTSGTYTFSMSGTFPEYLGVYQNAFVPGSPLTDVLRTSGSATGPNPNFTVDLTAGTTYVVVYMAFSSNQFGTYQGTITGPASINQTASSVTLGCQVQAIIDGRLDTCDPTSERALAGNPPAGASSDAPHYETVAFTVSQAGNYIVSMESAGAFREFLGVYENAFIPGSPATNAKRAGGNASGTDPELAVSLTAGTTYVATLTSFAAGELGAYEMRIDGPGPVQQTAGSITLGCPPPPPPPPDTSTTPTLETSPAAPPGASTTSPPGVTAPAADQGDTTAPLISALSAARARFAVGAGATALGPAGRKAPKGTTFRYTLSEGARVRVALTRPRAGRRVGAKCVKPTRRSARNRKCDLAVGTLSRDGAAGRNQLRFTGRLGRRALVPGRYRATFVATDAAGNSSRPRSLTFTIVR